MTELEAEIKSYHIIGSMRVRGSGSVYGQHQDRCLWDICGKPCIEWVLDAAKGSKYIDKIMVITESEGIKKVVKDLGGVTVIDRPLWTSFKTPRDFTQGRFKRNKPRSFLQEAPIYTDATLYAQYILERTEGYVTELRFNLGGNTPMITSEIIDRMIEKFFQDKGAAQISAFYPVLPYINIINLNTSRPVTLAVDTAERQLAIPMYLSAGYSFVGLASKVNIPPMEGQQGYIVITEEEGLDMHDESGLFKARCFMKQRLLREGKKVEWEIGKGEEYKVQKKGKKGSNE